MRHKIAHRKLNRTSEHRKALFKNMLNSLIKYEQITTTVPKAKELKSQIDKVITLGKKRNLVSKKSLFSKLQDKNSVSKLVKTLSKPDVLITLSFGSIGGDGGGGGGGWSVNGGALLNIVGRKGTDEGGGGINLKVCVCELDLLL